MTRLESLQETADALLERVTDPDFNRAASADEILEAERSYQQAAERVTREEQRLVDAKNRREERERFAYRDKLLRQKELAEAIVEAARKRAQARAAESIGREMRVRLDKTVCVAGRIVECSVERVEVRGRTLLPVFHIVAECGAMKQRALFLVTTLP
jgi:hypothetical protein